VAAMLDDVTISHPACAIIKLSANLVIFYQTWFGFASIFREFGKI
jgi:hypothetical protein